MGKLTNIKNRLYNDFIMPSRIKEYEEIIKKSLQEGYTHISLRDYYEKLSSKTLERKRYFIHRHDIDTDIKTTKKFFEVEKNFGIKSTYYFRLSTLDFKLMKEIEEYGSEASYHFEEIAQYCKDNHIKTKEEATKHLNEIKNIFKKNFKNIENRLSIKIKTVASHGDFVNRALKIINNEITNDLELREELGIKLEAYDKEFMNSIDIYISDNLYPVFYKPIHILDVIGKYDIICMLTHPRSWQSNIFVNLFDNIKRVYEGVKW